MSNLTTTHYDGATSYLELSDIKEGFPWALPCSIIFF